MIVHKFILSASDEHCTRVCQVLDLCSIDSLQWYCIKSLNLPVEDGSKPSRLLGNITKLLHEMRSQCLASITLHMSSKFGWVTRWKAEIFREASLTTDGIAKSRITNWLTCKLVTNRTRKKFEDTRRGILFRYH